MVFSCARGVSRPDDPLVSARQKAINPCGGNGFLTVAATHAALLLAQGAGRLLRSISDKGVPAPRVLEAEPELDPVLLTIPVQLLAYHVVPALGYDKPRSPAKSVTVE